jgi:hypothetical protein
MLRVVYVIYDDGRPLVEAYDGPQIVGMTCTGAGRCWSGWPRMATS